MADHTKLTWTDYMWMVLLGCTKTSAGCKVCWALTEAARYAANGSKLYSSLIRSTRRDDVAWTGRIVYQRNKLNEPAKLEKANIWVAPRSDPFHSAVPLEVLAEIYGVIVNNPQNNFQLLTKRVERMRELYTNGSLKEAIEDHLGRSITWPLPNTWEGTSVENEGVSERIRILLDTPSNSRFISFQPHLGAVDVLKHIGRRKEKVDFAIIGGEAGPGCRPFDRYALAETREQLVELGIKTLTQCYPI